MDLFEKKFIADQEHFKAMLDTKLSNLIDPEKAIGAMKLFYQNHEAVSMISAAKRMSEDFFRYNEMVQLNILLVAASINLDLEYNGVKATKEDLAKALSTGMLVANLDVLEDTSVFVSNPIISNVINTIQIVKEKNIDNPFYEKMLINILDSLQSVITLFDKKCFTQGMSVFRQALEHFITLKALDMNPNAMESYLEHQRITAADVLGEMTPEDLDNYIKENNLTYNTYKSYMNYGWLDEVEAYRKAKEEKPKLKYGIKVITDVTGQQEFYEAMDFASNYVHPNFIFVSVDWDLVISEVLDGIYQMLDWILEYLKSNGISLDKDGFDYSNVYIEIKNHAHKSLENGNYKFNIR